MSYPACVSNEKKILLQNRTGKYFQKNNQANIEISFDNIEKMFFMKQGLFNDKNLFFRVMC